MEEKKKHHGLWWQIPLGIILTIVLLFGLVIGGLNAFKFLIYSDFYNIMRKEGTIPGTNDGFVAQAICIDEENKITLLAGYQANKSEASRINVVYEDGTTRFLEMMDENGEIYNGHNSGMAFIKDKVWLADAQGQIVEVNYEDILNKENAKVAIQKRYNLDNNMAGFLYSYDDKVLVGEFNGYVYYPQNEYETLNDGKYFAIAEEYQIDDLVNPIRAFSICDYVQGMAFNDDGDALISTSYAVQSSYFYFYKVDSFTKSDKLHKGAPLYYLDKPTATLKAPAMAEELDYSNGRWYTSSESASDLYFFGKLFFADYWYSFEWDF